MARTRYGPSPLVRTNVLHNQATGADSDEGKNDAKDSERIRPPRNDHNEKRKTGKWFEALPRFLN